MTIRVLIADDHPVVREGLRALFDREADVEVIADCADGEEAVRIAEAERPDVVLLDLRMPRMDGVAATERIVALGAAPVVVLTTYDTDGDITRALGAGAAGYLLKDMPRDELIAAVRAVARGETVLSATAMSAVADGLRNAWRTLSVREHEVLAAMSRGLSNPQIGRELFITEATVKSHVTRIFAKLGVDDRTAAVTAALASGILPLPRPSRGGAASRR